MGQVFVGRQPIFDRKTNIFGYELLYRNSEENFFPNINPELATMELLMNTFFTIGIDEVAHRKKSFINFSEPLLYDDMLPQLNTNTVIIEILEDIPITPSLLERLKKLRTEGFTFALDDFILKDDNPLIEELFKLIHIIKINYLHTTRQERERVENMVKSYPHITLLAEKLETEVDYQEALNKGYRLFQGYYFSKPDIVKGKDIPQNYAIHFYLFQRLNEPEPDFKEISDIIKRDISLSYKLLRYVNSLAFSIPYDITSIQQALIMLGFNNAKKWIHILLLYDIGVDSGKGPTKGLIESSLIRAKVLELLAVKTGREDYDACFLTGMFSLIDCIMEQDLGDLLEKLSLSSMISDTLLGRTTEFTPYLNLAKALEAFDFEVVEQQAEMIGVTLKEVSDLSQAAQKWVHRF